MDNEQLNEQNFTPQQEAQIENEVKTACQETTPPMPKPNNNLALAIFTTVCCCLPFGIVAIIKASKVDSSMQQDIIRKQLLKLKLPRNTALTALSSALFSGLSILFCNSSWPTLKCTDCE